jgi:hypothetical protein
MFGVADAFDVALMAIGSCGSLVIGLSNPAFNVLFGEMIDTLSRGSMTFTELVAQLCIVLVIIACVNVFAGFLQVSDPIFAYHIATLLNVLLRGGFE